MRFQDELTRLNACKEAVAWVGDRTEAEAWEDCERADWLAWYAFCAKKGTREQRIEAICQIAEDALPIYELRFPGDSCPRKAIEAACAASAADAAAWAVADAARAEAWAAAHKKYCKIIRCIVRREEEKK